MTLLFSSVIRSGCFFVIVFNFLHRYLSFVSVLSDMKEEERKKTNRKIRVEPFFFCHLQLRGIFFFLIK